MIRFVLSLFIKGIYLINSCNNKLIRFILNKFNKKFYYSKDYHRLDFQYHSPNLIKKQNKIGFNVPLSFKGFLNIRSFRAYNSRLNTPEWYLNSKSLSLKFADVLKLNLPNTYQNGVSAESLFIKNRSVIKPLKGTGSRNVFIVFDENRILNLFDKTYCSKGEMLKILNKEQFKYFSQELITSWDGEVRDYKFYSFYGEVPIVLEVSRTPVLRYCFWNNNNERIDTGKYSEKEKFVGKGIKPEYIQLVKRISKSIPAPFVRIDFLHSAKNDELYFCEFTPRPGGYINFNKDIDILLGQEFAEAEERLFKDMLDGKRFKEYKELL